MSKIVNSLNSFRVGLSGAQYRYAYRRIYNLERIVESELSDYGRGVSFGLKFARQVLDDMDQFIEVDGVLQEVEHHNSVDDSRSNFNLSDYE